VEKEMRHLPKLTAISFLLLYSVAPSWAVLQKGEKFLPFSLISIKDEIFTVRLDEGKLSVAIESTADSAVTKKVIHPDAVLIDFWATWCVPCRAAMPHMQGLYNKYKPAENQESGGLVLLGISIDTKGSQVVKPFYKNLEYTYPMLADSTQGDDDLIRTAKDMKSQYRVQAIPVVYLIDSEGIIRHVHTGFKEKDIDDIETVIEALAAEKSK
jgi:thiol-disulfide isomerase/thioredoxin